MAVNTGRVAAGQALGVLQAGWRAQQAGTLRTAYMLHGKPGVGKTQIVEALAREIGATLYDVRLTTIEPQDLRGLPYYDHEAQTTKWYRPEDLPRDPDQPAVLFLDELTAAAPQIQPTVYGLLQERRVGNHHLPDSVFLVAAGNQVEDGAIAYDMGTGLSDRVIHIAVQAQAADWLENFAIPHGLDPAVQSFIKVRPDLLDTTDATLSDGHMIACTPRSWERVSHILRAVEDRTLRNIMVSGTVGDAVAAEFAIVADDIAATVRVADMLEAAPADRIAMYPGTLHGLTALIYGLIGALRRETVLDVVQVMATVRTLAQRRPDLAGLPLGELCTYGFEALIRKGLADGLGPDFLASPDYQAYQAERDAMGLT
ncbi:AAA family ATPase [Actibacterium sp. 188UL27-1]|uniref:AAA family ATPase n=1 Tax=Actibacterium sp. 188UL27-1 TaxID=2786961 RepID=UPI00195C5F4F|nr:MoxR family ATPase [Actibacterium sp. 188UL27-1]MBM7068149.1 AAA family ATPase [Actibacterium sp. 188UL27-1]